MSHWPELVTWTPSCKECWENKHLAKGNEIIVNGLDINGYPLRVGTLPPQTKLRFLQEKKEGNDSQGVVGYGGMSLISLKIP